MNNKKRKTLKKGEQKGYIEIEFNLSAAIIKIVVICIIIGVITGAKVITTVIEAKKTDVLAATEETSSRVTWVDSTELDENGNAKQVPVPKGFTASQIDGETTVSGGFVIYEGDVDWSKIIVDSAEESEVPQTDTKVDEGANEITETNINTDSGANETEDEILNIADEETESETENNINAEKITEQGTNINEEETTEDQDNIVKEEITKTEENIPTGDPTTIEKTDIITKQATIEDTTANEAILVDETAPADETTDVATQTEINIFNLQKSTNQYVWVPIEDVSELYGVDSNGKIWGKLYKFSSSGRTANNWSETNGIMSITSKTGHREPEITELTGYDIDSQLPRYISGQTRYELLAKEMEQNFYDMIKSIKQYGGFYIGRYETGGLNGTAVIQKMNTDIGRQSWYTMYKKCQQLGVPNENITTSMIWGTLWDATLEWLVDSCATNSRGTQLTYNLIGADSTTWGNYINATFEYITSNATTPMEKTQKLAESVTKIPTGSAEYTKVNNIYDMAGNVFDWTLISLTNNKVVRGGCVDRNSSSAAYNSDGPNNYTSDLIGCRVSLWIK